MEGNTELATPKTVIMPPTQERSVSEGNLVGNLERLLYMFRLITHQSTIKRSEIKSERPLSLRTTRAQLFKEFKQTPKADREARSSILDEAHVRDEIARQYLNQGEVKVNVPNLGEQSARYSIINPPEGRRTVDTDSKPPIFLIPGISNDIDCVGALAQEIPFMGRKVIVVGMPESQMGKVTLEFAKAVSDSSSFGPHVEFFKGAINALVGENSQVELWGHSAGSAIIAEILNDPKFQERVTDAVFLNPASSANISEKALNLGVLNELRNLVGRNLPKYTLTVGATSNLPDTQEQKSLKANVTKLMLKKVCTLAEGWKKARVREGGKILVYSGRKDQLTRSYELFKEDRDSLDRVKYINHQIEVIDDPNGFHSTPLTEPQRVIRQIFNKQSA